jgi:hypothetical protein
LLTRERATEVMMNHGRVTPALGAVHLGAPENFGQELGNVLRMLARHARKHRAEQRIAWNTRVKDGRQA